LVCGVAGCGQPLQQLVQLHCPIPGAHRRTLHVLACRRAECTARKTSAAASFADLAALMLLLGRVRVHVLTSGSRYGTEPGGWVAIRGQAADATEQKATDAGADGEAPNVLDMLAAMDSVTPVAASGGPAEPGQRRPINTNEVQKHRSGATKTEREPEPEPEPEPDTDGSHAEEEKPPSISPEDAMLARVAALSVQQLLNQKVGFIQDRLAEGKAPNAAQLAGFLQQTTQELQVRGHTRAMNLVRSCCASYALG